MFQGSEFKSQLNPRLFFLFLTLSAKYPHIIRSVPRITTIIVHILFYKNARLASFPGFCAWAESGICICCTTIKLLILPVTKLHDTWKQDYEDCYQGSPTVLCVTDSLFLLALSALGLGVVDHVLHHRSSHALYEGGEGFYDGIKHSALRGCKLGILLSQSLKSLQRGRWGAKSNFILGWGLW